MRAICSDCRLSAHLCLCASLQPMSIGTAITVLQHPREVNHPKNTLRLARLCLPQVQICVGESAADFEALQAKLGASALPSVLCYPSQHSVPLESDTEHSPKQLIFIDATWKKAHKMWCLNPWLQALPCYHFSAAPAGDYRLRKTSRTNGLSTLEAIAYSVAQMEKIDVQPLYGLQQLWVERMQQMMPAAVRTRYEP